MWRILRYKIGEGIGVLILVTIDLSNWRKIQMIRVIATVKLKKRREKTGLFKANLQSHAYGIL